MKKDINKLKEKELFGRLYFSIYKDNIKEVYNILNNYPKKCQKNFLRNIKELSFDHDKFKEIKNYLSEELTSALYIPNEKKIYLNGFNNTKPEINHELFHVASDNNTDIGVVIILKDKNRLIRIGTHLNEGITDKLAIDSLNQKEVTSDHDLEVFVIENLLNIYGNKILIPYFEGKPRKFYTQFKKNSDSIIELELLLEIIKQKIKMRDTFSKYILLKEYDKESLIMNNLYIKSVDLNPKSILLFNKWLDERNDLISNIYIDNKNISKKIINKDNIELYNYWINIYSKEQKESFEKILKILIKLYRKKEIDETTIKDSLINTLDNKNHFIDLLAYTNKKLIKKK